MVRHTPTMTSSLRLPEIAARTAHMHSSHSRMGSSKPDRFTKLKGVLVNNLLKEYHKQTRQQGDQIVYNHAVMEVEKILAHNTRLTEDQLQELQRSFASGVMINVPNRNIHVGTKMTRKSTYDAKDAKLLAASRSLVGNQNNVPPTAGASVGMPQSRAMTQGIQTDHDTMQLHSPSHPMAEAVEESPGSVQSKRQRRVDEWSILVLHNDVMHLEEQKKEKEKQALFKKKTREELLQQIKLKEELKKKVKSEVLDDAKRNEENYMKWKAEQDRAAQMKQAKILAEKEYEAKELARAQKVKQIQAERDFKEQQAMLAEFSRQIEEEKRAKELEVQAKAAAYQEMLKGNAKVLERKKALKEAERKENQRLFDLQMEMAEKQERIRQKAEEERQMRLKKAERMAGELGSRAAELDAELETRIRKAQEEWRQRDQARDRMEKEKKKRLDNETATTLAKQVEERNKQRETERRDRESIAKQYRNDAEALAQAELIARKERQNRKMAVQQDLNKQLALKMAKNSNSFVGMSTTEIKMNKSLLQKVLEEKTPDENVPDEIRERLEIPSSDPRASALKTPREIR